MAQLLPTIVLCFAQTSDLKLLKSFPFVKKDGIDIVIDVEEGLSSLIVFDAAFRSRDWDILIVVLQNNFYSFVTSKPDDDEAFFHIC